MNNNFLKNNFANLKSTFLRFPLAIISSILLSILFVIDFFSSGNNYYGIYNNDIENFYAYKNILTLGIFVFIFVSLLNSFLECIFNKTYYKIITNVLGIVFIGIIYYFYYYLNENIYIEGLMIFFIISSMYVEILKNPRRLQSYLYKILRSLGIALLFTIVILVGTLVIVFAIDNLFFGENWDLYGLIILVITNTVFVVIFLSNFPKGRNYEENNISNYFKIIIGKVIPILITIFGFVLYFYLFTVLIRREMAVENIAYLVIIYGLVSIATLIMIRLISNDKDRNIFSKILPITLLPLVALLFFSMGTRIKSFGVTENRYYVIVLGIWILISAIYFIVNKYKNNIPILTIASILILITTIGPISAVNTSERSQVKRLEYYLNKNNMIEDEKIIPSENISSKDKNEIRSILNYLNNGRYSKKVKLVENTGKDFFENSIKYLGFNLYDYDDDTLTEEENNEKRYIEFGDDYFKVSDITGYSNVVGDSFAGPSNIGDYFISIENNNLTVEKNGDKQFISYDDIEKKLKEREDDYNINFDFKIDNKEVKFVIELLYVQYGGERLDGRITILEK